MVHKVYIAGPMTGLPEFNRPAFFSMAEHVKCTGAVPLNPATLPDGLTQPEYMDICIAMMRCATKVIFLNGWQHSLGARAEMALAEKLGLVIEHQGKHMILTPDDNEILERLSATGSTPDSVANLLRCAGYSGMTGKSIRLRLMKLEKEKAVERVRRPDIKKTCWAPATK